MEKDRKALKEVFITGYKPTEQDFSDLLESCLLVTDASGIDAKGAASTTKKGLVEEATLAEVEAGTDAERYVTPAGAKRAVEKHSLVKSVNGKTGNVVLDASNSEDSGWVKISLLNNAVDIGNDGKYEWEGSRYRKVDDRIELQGLIKGKVSRVDTHIFTLPIGSRPLKKLMLPILQREKASVELSVLEIDSAGKVVVISIGSDWTNITGVNFSIGTTKAGK